MLLAVVGAACALMGLGCGAAETGTKEGSLGYGASARQAYLAALEEFRDGNCLEIESEFRRIRREFPYSRFAALAELRIADCMMRQKKYAEAIQAYRQFTRFRPSHELVPYARFKMSEAHYEQIPSDSILFPPAHERDQGPAKNALRQLRRFLLDYPDDERAVEAKEMMKKTLRLLAEHELYVARFYIERGAFSAAVSRLETLLNTYQGSGIEPEALLLLGRTYLSMKERHEARRVFQRLVQGFPESEQAGEARRRLRRLSPTSSAGRAAAQR